MGWITSIFSVVSWLASFFKPKTDIEKSYEAGKDAGITAQKASDYQGVLNDAQTAKNATDAVSPDADQFMRDANNSGPAHS